MVEEGSRQPEGGPPSGVRPISLPPKPHHFIKHIQVRADLLELPRKFCGGFLEAIELALEAGGPRLGGPAPG